VELDHQHCENIIGDQHRCADDQTGFSCGGEKPVGLAGFHPRGYGTFPRFLGHYVRDRKVVSLEEAIRRLTSLSAAQVGINDRGRGEVGNYTDLVLFDPETIIDRSTTEAPHTPSLGIDMVWVNGEVVFKGGQVTRNLPGKPIRRAIH